MSFAQVKLSSVIKIIVYGLLLFGLFHSSYRVMFSWWQSEDFNYCYLIPFIVLYLVWEKRDVLAKTPSCPSWWGLIPVVLGIGLYWLGELGGEFYTLYFASWLLFAGILWVHIGWAKLRHIWFPVVFLLAMFPPPNIINFPLSLKLRLISSQLGVCVPAALLACRRTGKATSSTSDSLNCRLSMPAAA